MESIPLRADLLKFPYYLPIRFTCISTEHGIIIANTVRVHSVPQAIVAKEVRTENNRMGSIFSKHQLGDTTTMSKCANVVPLLKWNGFVIDVC